MRAAREKENVLLQTSEEKFYYDTLVYRSPVTLPVAEESVSNLSDRAANVARTAFAKIPR